MKLFKLSIIIVFMFALLGLPSISLAEEIKPVDVRVLALRYYLETYKSPLALHSEKLIAEADKYNMDWRLIPAIAAVESNFGHRIPGGKDPDFTSHNAWGWGVYGQKVIRFEDWEQGIERVSEGINRRFIAEGLTDPYKMNSKYSSNPDWGWQVVFFMDELETYSQAFEHKFGSQILAYNKRINNELEEQKDASKYILQKPKMVITGGRFSML